MYRFFKPSRLLIAAVCCLMLGMRATAQVAIVPQPHQEGYFTLDDIWRVAVISPGAQSRQVRLEATIEDAQHQAVVTAQSPLFLLRQGNNRPNFSAASASMHYGALPAASILRSTGRLPYGNYILCYRVLDAAANALLGEFCQEEQVRPFSPPELVSPYDRESVQTTLPLLTWKPPFPPGSAPIEYTMVLKEIRKDQTPLEAMEKNTPMVSRRGLFATVLPYPPDAPKLDVGKSYVWQVTARAGGVELGATEVWAFKVGGNAIDGRPTGNIHYEYMSDDQDNIPFVMASDSVGLIIDHGYITLDNFRLFYDHAIAGDQVPSLALVPKTENTDGTWVPSSYHDGTNYFVFDLKALGLTNGDYYLIKASDQKKTYYLYVKYVGS
jgi:hypothetical protein